MYKIFIKIFLKPIDKLKMICYNKEKLTLKENKYE